MKPGEISKVIPGPNGNFYIFRLSRFLPADGVKLEDVKSQVREAAREAKIQEAASEKLDELMRRAVIKRGI